jgi:hypothetical protein
MGIKRNVIIPRVYVIGGLFRGCLRNKRTFCAIRFFVRQFYSVYVQQFSYASAAIFNKFSLILCQNSFYLSDFELFKHKIVNVCKMLKLLIYNRSNFNKN